MGLKIFSAKKYSVKLKATIHASGKLGFTENTANFFEICPGSGIKFANDENNKLFMIFCKEADDDCFAINKAGAYYYVNAKPLFDDLGFDYRNNSIIFDITKADNFENTYKLTIRIKPRK
ncbi:MAG: hypothetical protein MJY74_00120 [Bacteroidaceae bacterium]|nr:hypothetical protein [Bacteroidaceae bacterium]